MVETHISLSVNRLLNEDTYAIPLYQRNFAWTYDEIEQLLNDVADAFQEKRDNYYIGTLVVNEENDLFKIIDGQQRTTALNLIALALKHEFGFDRLKSVNLIFPARKKSNENIQKLFTKQKISECDENELTKRLVQMRAAGGGAYEEYVKLLDELAEAKRVEPLMKEYGTARTASGALEARVAEIMHADPKLSRAQAVVRAYQIDPDIPEVL